MLKATRKSLSLSSWRQQKYPPPPPPPPTHYFTDRKTTYLEYDILIRGGDALLNSFRRAKDYMSIYQ